MIKLLSPRKGSSLDIFSLHFSKCNKIFLCILDVVVVRKTPHTFRNFHLHQQEYTTDLGTDISSIEFSFRCVFCKRAGFYFFFVENIILRNARFRLNIDFLPRMSEHLSKCRWSEPEHCKIFRAFLASALIFRHCTKISCNELLRKCQKNM